MENQPSTAAAEPGAPGLFSEVIFYIVESDKLPREVADKTRKTLLENGATEAEKRTDPDDRIPFDPLEVTHVIAADVDFPGQLEVEEAMKPIVTPAWVETSATKGRLSHVRPFTPDPRLFFSGVMVTIAELPVGDKEAICGGILAMGGQYSSNLTKLTTHIVALNMDNEKCKHAAAKKLSVKMVLPHWFDDCLKLNRRIDESPYLLPNPEVERLHSTQPLPYPAGPDLTYTHFSGVDQPPTPRPNFKVFSGKKVYLGTDLGISPGLRNVIAGIIKQALGEITDNILDAHVYVGQWREGTDYMTASRRGLDVGNLTWLYWMFAHGQWTNPMKRLLHYPLHKKGIKGMEEAVITVSNYGGDARLYLESLITAAGATFTKSMKTENTHLITARAHSEKCTAAREWNIHMVNHLWLEESYAKWRVLSVADPKYTHFPTRTNLTEVVGQTQICPRTIQKFYEGQGGATMALGDREESPTAEKGAKNSATSNLKKGKKEAVHKAPAARAPQEMQTPTARKFAASDTPSSVLSAGGRRAKEQATQRLHELAPDIALFAKEMKRKGGVLHSGSSKRRSSTPVHETKKRAASSAEPDISIDEDGDVDMTDPKPKKPKKRVKPSIKLLITGYNDWKDASTKEEADKRKLLDMGILCVPDPQDCTHLAAPKVIRTEKFLCALARAPVVVSTSWIQACLNESRIVDTDGHLLRDPDGEAKYNMSLTDSLSRASKVKGQLLKGMVIYCAPGVNGGFETCSHIVQANGGICINFKAGKRGANLENTESGGIEDDGKLVLLSGGGPGDTKLWKPFVAMAQGMGLDPLIYRMDWLLDLAMTQKVVFDDSYLVPEKKR